MYGLFAILVKAMLREGERIFSATNVRISAAFFARIFLRIHQGLKRQAARALDVSSR
jgi:hypothetical protein